MTHEELVAKVNQLNAESKRLNEVRQKNIGQKEALEKQLNEGIASYNQQYGANLSIDTLQQEYTNVSAEVEAQAQKVEQQITEINNQLEQAKNGTLQNNVQVETPTPSTEQVAPSPEPVPQPTPQVAEPIPEVATTVPQPTPVPTPQVAPQPTVVAEPTPTVEHTPTVEQAPPTVEQQSTGFAIPQMPEQTNPNPVPQFTVPVAPEQPQVTGVFAQSFETPQATEPQAPPSFSDLLAGSDFGA